MTSNRKIKLLLFLFKLTHSEKVYAALNREIDKQTEKAKYSTIKSRWEKVELQNQLRDLSK